MCVFRRKYVRSAALAPDRPPARPPGRQPSPASPPCSRSASQSAPQTSGIIIGNANGILNRNMLRTDLSPAYIQLPRRNGRSPGRSAAAPRQASAGARVPLRRAKPQSDFNPARIDTRDPPHWTFRIPVSGHRKSSAKIAYSGATCVISLAATGSRSCNPPRCAPWFSS